MSENSAAAMVVIHEGKLLIVARGNKFALPAGKVEANETFLQAAIRETFEETGVTVNKALFLKRGVVGINNVETFLAEKYFCPTELNGNEGTPSWGSWEDVIGNVGAYQEYNLSVYEKYKAKIKALKFLSDNSIEDIPNILAQLTGDDV